MEFVRMPSPPASETENHPQPRVGHPPLLVDPKGWLVLGIFLAVIGGFEWSRLSANYHSYCTGVEGAFQSNVGVAACSNELMRVDFCGLTALAGVLMVILAIATWSKVRT